MHLASNSLHQLLFLLAACTSPSHSLLIPSAPGEAPLLSTTQALLHPQSIMLDRSHIALPNHTSCRPC